MRAGAVRRAQSRATEYADLAALERQADALLERARHKVARLFPVGTPVVIPWGRRGRLRATVSGHPFTGADVLVKTGSGAVHSVHW